MATQLEKNKAVLREILTKIIEAGEEDTPCQGEKKEVVVRHYIVKKDGEEVFRATSQSEIAKRLNANPSAVSSALRLKNKVFAHTVEEVK